MAGEDAELELLRNNVTCAALLENFAGWRLDRRESTRRALKYRRGKGDILIVNHEGRGWWDPQGAAKGDVFDLVQHLDPNLNFGQVRQVLRRLVGMPPAFPGVSRDQQDSRPSRSPAARWAARPWLRPGSPAWRYLAETRGLPACVLRNARDQDAVREGPTGSAWFAHRRAGAVCHVEIRGPACKSALAGGRKALFRFAGAGEVTVHRLVVAEAPIDALSLAALEHCRAGTLYLATGGGMGPATLAALMSELRAIAPAPDALLSSATDANPAGERFTAQHAELAEAAGVPFERLAPPRGEDWNDTLRTRIK